MILRSEWLVLSSLLVVSAQAAETRASESLRPRGVGPECKKCPTRRPRASTHSFGFDTGPIYPFNGIEN